MSDNKTEQATPGKIRKAAEKGQIGRSKDLGSAASLICVVIFLVSQGDNLGSTVKDVIKFYFSFNKESLHAGYDVRELIGVLIKTLLSIFAPLMVIQWVIVPLSTLAVGGLHFNFVQVKPKLEKISPIQGIKRIFSMNTIVELFKSIIKISTIFFLFFYTIESGLPKLTSLSRSTFQTSVDTTIKHLFVYSSYLILVIVFFALFDAGYQKYAFMKKLRMSKQDQKDEHKEQEGSPEVKQRIRQIQMAASKKSVNQTVPTADIILANPTHFSVALKYDITKAQAPFVVAKGADEMALYIKEVAIKNKIPIYEYPPLARAVYNTTGLEQMIPNQLFVAVAEVLSYIKQLARYQRNEISKPDEPKNLPIPPDFYEIK